MLLSLGQNMLNEQIAASTAARDRLADIEGKRFAVVIKNSDVRIVAECAEGQIRLIPSRELQSDCELTAGLFDLVRLARSSGLTEIRNVGASLNGELNVAESFADVLRLAIPEPEAWLADWIGDMPAHAAGQAARRFGGWARRSGRAIEQDVAEYLQEERPTLIPPALARDFCAEVDRIRDDVERAERRLAMLESRLAGRRA